MAATFPTNPLNGDQATVNNITYVYASATRSWTRVTSNAAVGGSNTQIQYNNANAFGGSAAFTFNNLTNAIVATGNITSGNLLTGGLISATGNITSAANITAGNTIGTHVGAVAFGANTVSGTGNITGGNVLFGSGVVSGTGNITAGNTIGTHVGAVAFGANTVSGTGNITGGNVLYGAGIISGTGNTTVGNLLTSGMASAAGNIYGNVLIANNNTGGNFFIHFGGLSNVVGGSIRFNPASKNTTISGYDTGGLYLNYDSGTGGINFCNGLNGVTGSMSGGGVMNLSTNVAAANTTSGTLVVAGGVGVGGNIFAAGNISGGNLGVGTTSLVGSLRVKPTGSNYANGVSIQRSDTSDTYELVVGGDSGLYLGYANNASGATTAANFTTRVLLDSGGNLMVGTPNSSATAGVGAKIIADANQPYVATVGTSSSNTNSAYLLYSTGAGAYRFYVGYGGTISATSTSITGISDQRLKENIRDLDDGLEKVLALKPRKFDWKENKGKGIANDRGFIAQEFEQVFPDMIEEWMDKPPEGEEPYKAVNANLLPVLVKAIQEQQAIIEQLKADIAALKGQA